MLKPVILSVIANGIFRLKMKSNVPLSSNWKGIPTCKVCYFWILYAKGIRVQSLVGRLPETVTEG